MKKRASVARAAKLDTTLDSLATPHSLGYRMPAEWEPHAATWLAWPHEPTDWPGKFDAIPWVFAEVARHLQEGERIRVIVSGKTARGVCQECAQSFGREPEASRLRALAHGSLLDA